MAQLNEHTNALRDLSKPLITIDPATGNMTFDTSLMAKIAENEGTNLETIEKSFNTVIAAMAGAGAAAGEACNEAAAANKGLTHISGSLPLTGKDTINFDWNLSRTYPGVDGRPDVTKHGVMKMGLDIYGAGRRGQVGAAIDHVAAQAGEMAAAGLFNS